MGEACPNGTGTALGDNSPTHPATWVEQTYPLLLLATLKNWVWVWGGLLVRSYSESQLIWDELKTEQLNNLLSNFDGQPPSVCILEHFQDCIGRFNLKIENFITIREPSS